MCKIFTKHTQNADKIYAKCLHTYTKCKQYIYKIFTKCIQSMRTCLLLTTAVYGSQRPGWEIV